MEGFWVGWPGEPWCWGRAEGASTGAGAGDPAGIDARLDGGMYEDIECVG